MSKPHGWLLGVGGLDESEVAPKNYSVVETSKKKKEDKTKGGYS